MSIKRRLSLLLGLLTAGFFGVLLLVRQIENRERARLLETARDQRAELLNHWLEAVGRTLPELAAELAQSAEFAHLLNSAEPPARDAALRRHLQDADVDSLWLVRADGTIDVETHAASRLTLPFGAGELASLVSRAPHARFFIVAGDELLEASVRRLHTAGQWLLLGRRWGAARIEALSKLIEGTVTLAPPKDLAHPPDAPEQITLVRPLYDANGNPVRTLRVEYDASDIAHSLHAGSSQTYLLIAFGLLLTTGVGLALQSWVIRPLQQISTSLAKSDPAPARAVSAERSELGRVAELVLSSFAQREALQHEIAERTQAQAALQASELELRRNLEERARLGRDLHDGVIQSLYAAGMGLAGIRPLLRADQIEAATRLEQTRAALNETIHDVRNFIVGLEPEALKLQSFAQAVGALADAMRTMRPFTAHLQIDEELAAKLTLSQRVHALQIAREAISNALRHGEAANIRVSLQRRGLFAAFEVADDGHGFDTAAAAYQGRGLANFSERARELGAELTVTSTPNAGTMVMLVIALPQL